MRTPVFCFWRLKLLVDLKKRITNFAAYLLAELAVIVIQILVRSVAERTPDSSRDQQPLITVLDRFDLQPMGSAVFVDNCLPIMYGFCFF
jgi:hypothetical protein